MSDQARVVIVGGGVIGCSIAYHLTRMGEPNVLVLEKSGLTHGATWHAAGLVGQLRSQRNLTRMMQYSAELYGRLEAETGVAIDWRRVGSLRLAATADRWLEIKRAFGQSRAFGLEIELLSPSEAGERFPQMTTDGIVGAAFIPGDGYVDPSGLTQAYARGARSGGATFREGVQVTGFAIGDGRVDAVLTEHDRIDCEFVVNAAGLWAREVAAMAGVAAACGVVEHQYMVTEKSAAIGAETPTLRDPDGNFYVKPDVGGLAIGGWEHQTRALPEGLPFAFGRELFPSNMERFEEIALPASARLPVLSELGVQSLINGPIPISADGEPIMGPVPGLANLFMACGFTSGIAASGGAGRAMAQWITEGDPGMDLWAFDIRRFGPHHGSRRFLHERAVESYARYYKVHYPANEMTSGRYLRQSPLHGHLKNAGAVFGSKFGWERANWFAPNHVPAIDEPSFSRANWFDHVAAEHRAVRENVAIIDQSSFSKFEISGTGAQAFLQYLATNDMDRPVGSAVYTQLCNMKGGIEADLTVMRTAEDRFYVVTGSGFGVRDGHWIRSHMPENGSVRFADITSRYAVINLCGPRARQVLQKISDDDIDNNAFPYLSCRTIQLGYASVLAVRISYVGELGWELHAPVEFAAHVYQSLVEAGREFDMMHVGYRAIDSLRMEKRYLYWSADLSPDYSPFHAGLGFCVALDKGDFIGAEALARIREDGPAERLFTFIVDDPAAHLHGGEPIVSDGAICGITTSGNFGHTIGKGIAFGYVPAECITAKDFEIECFGERYAATRIPDVPYDPERVRLRT